MYVYMYGHLFCPTLYAFGPHFHSSCCESTHLCAGVTSQQLASVALWISCSLSQCFSADCAQMLVRIDAGADVAV